MQQPVLSKGTRKITTLFVPCTCFVKSCPIPVVEHWPLSLHSSEIKLTSGGNSTLSTRHKYCIGTNWELENDLIVDNTASVLRQAGDQERKCRGLRDTCRACEPLLTSSCWGHLSREGQCDFGRAISVCSSEKQLTRHRNTWLLPTLVPAPTLLWGLLMGRRQIKVWRTVTEAGGFELADNGVLLLILLPLQDLSGPSEPFWPYLQNTALY